MTTHNTHVRARRRRLRGPRRSIAMLAAIGLATFGLVTSSPPAFAASGGIHDSGIQELDGSIDFTGNTTDYLHAAPGADTSIPASPAYDWSSLFKGDSNGVITSTGAACQPGSCAGLLADVGAPYTGDLFVQGSKDVGDVPSWTCTKQSTPPKDQLVNTYASAWTAQATVGGIQQNDTVAFLGLERPSVNGNANAGFWLFKKSVICDPTTGKFSGSHSNGDLFLVGSFLGGGSNAVLNQYKWLCTQVSTTDSSCASTGSLSAPTAGVLNCPTITSTTDTFCQVTNQKRVTSGGTTTVTNWTVKTPWSNIATGTAGIPGPGFLEIGIDLSQALATPGTAAPCFASFLADTRSSGSSTQAETKNFINGSFPTCRPTTTMTNTAMSSDATTVNGVGTAHLNQNVTFTVYEKNDGTDTLTSPSVTGTGCTSWTASGGDTNSNGKLDPGEEWSFTCTTSFSSAGSKTVTAVGHGHDANFAGSPDVTFCATSDATHICDSDETNNISILIISPNTSLQTTTAPATATPATIHSGESSTLAFYEKNTGDTVLTNPHVDTDLSGLCSTTTVVTGVAGGDANSNGIFDPGETWKFTCSRTFATTTTVTATGHGTDPLGRDITTPGYTLETTSVTVTVINPNTSLQVPATPATATPATIHSGESSTLAFYEKNTGDTVLTNPHVDTDSSGLCSTTTVVTGVAGGDANNNGIFDPGETWKFTCSQTFATTTTVIAIGHGTDPVGRDITTPGYTLETTSVTVTVINPDTELTTSANAVITYTFREKNTGDTALSSPSVSLTAAASCDATPAYVSGDGNANGKLDTTETWIFQCTQTLVGPTTDTGTVSTTATGVGHGVDSATTPADVTHCDLGDGPPLKRCSSTERDGTTVTITNSARD